MNKEVLISITGLQFESTGDDAIEMIIPGTYYFKNKKHYIIFDELIEGTSSITRNTIKFDEDIFELKRKGAVNVHMIFDTERKTLNNYSTPFGNLLIGISTSDISINESKEKLAIEVEYILDVNYEFLSNCKLNLCVTERK